jgi:hypothetical protein
MQVQPELANSQAEIAISTLSENAKKRLLTIISFMAGNG